MAQVTSARACEAPANWHALTAQETAHICAADMAIGLGGAEAARRLHRHGPNALPEPPPAPLWRTFVRQFKSPLISILFLAALLAIFLAGTGDAAVILGVVLVNAVIGTVQEHRAERSMSELRKLSTLQVRVLRDGAQQTISARDVTVGDVLLLAAGDAVAADARLFEQAQLHLAEAALTGESVPVAKSVEALPLATALADRRNMVYSGTHVTAGRGKAVVVAVAAHTEVGAIAQLTAGAQEPVTPLEARLGRFGNALLAAAFALFVLIIALGIWRTVPLPELVMVAISQMVSMVPEGLPVAMTIALAVGVQRMARRGAIIRRLSAVETLGSTTVICTDKTGTLTRNEMTAVALWLPGGREVSVGGVGYAPQGELIEAGRPAGMDSAVRKLLAAAALCNDADLRLEGEGSGWTVSGDPTEGALLVLARKAGMDPDDLRRGAPRRGELPFDSEARLMATWHLSERGPSVAFLKGAPEAVLRLTHDSAVAHAARAAAEAMAGRALRVLAFARIDDPPAPAAGFDALAGRARLLGLVGQLDAPREEVEPAVAECRRAGIRPVVVTGDHKLTALAIARELGIALPGDIALDGVELERLTEPDLRGVIDRVAVFARVQPAQKMRIVEALQARGEVVAMTGDGVNDAPALARADVGVAMGRTGTEVAKSAARVVVTDDNFATIVAAVEQGRIVYGNIKKLILYLFATSIDEVAILLLALFSGSPMPLAAVQILWINVVTEGTLTLNMIVDAPEGEEMRRRPVPRNDPLLDAGMLRRASLMALVTVSVTFWWFLWRLGQAVDLAQVRTEAFTLLAMCQWFNALNCRSSHRSALAGLLTSPWLLAGLALSVVLQLAVVFLPALNALFHTTPLTADVFLELALLASAVLWVEEGRKQWLRLRRRGAG